ncbi:MAG: magnesium transporter [Bacteroidetes bacterium MedPE-SWsnd-G1]|uniref:Magnesium transporter MgtE n=1 Tax=Urechidicola vernalis TaxID=3075600 RepID=A0ABU2Y7P9_9FLAO|nr:magnesium transporter [Urechidicola sp. P050]MDT0554224.1 magnesium transporter [Urechidicola sp. P050]OIQ37531.1 MAG: magnesium transporter [Bacteroidetes bacterium MedPE-SWsnd-G1]
MAIEINKDLITQIAALVATQSDVAIQELLAEEHFADVAEILDEVNFDEATYIIKLLDSEKTSDILMELDEDVREKILKNLSVKEIAEEIDELDSDDAADIIAELPEERQEKVISEIEDEEFKADIQELLAYDEDSAGGLMAKEMVMVNENWTVTRCVKEMRTQAEEVTRVHSIYVVNDEGQLIGRLSLKDLLMAPARGNISKIVRPKVDFVNVNLDAEEVAKVMQKYDLEAIPVVDDNQVLVGRITIDDIVDVIKEEAEKDYQLAAGISQDVEADDSIKELVKARLPWLILGLFGGLGAVFIMEGFEDALSSYKHLFFFTPLIAAMAGNVGVQSSAIIVQGLANDIVKGSLLNRLLKEVGLSLINGIVLGLIILAVSPLIGLSFQFGLTIALSMLCVIIVAALVGTFVPIVLDKRGIDPAIATGPFITTSNDIFGIYLFFIIAKMMLGGF